MEGRGLAEGNLFRQNKLRTQSRKGSIMTDLQNALERIRQAACRDKRMRFTALWHHVYNVDRLRKAYYSLKRSAAPGVDGETWASYGQDLEENLLDLSDRLQRGAYRAKPVKRGYIPKPDGRQRPLGITGITDCRATVANSKLLFIILPAYGLRSYAAEANGIRPTGRE